MSKIGDRVIVKGRENYSIGISSIIKVVGSSFFAKATDIPYYKIGHGTIIIIGRYVTFVKFDNFDMYCIDNGNISGIITLCA
jgi:hypothetical protein